MLFGLPEDHHLDLVGALGNVDRYAIIDRRRETLPPLLNGSRVSIVMSLDGIFDVGIGTKFIFGLGRSGIARAGLTQKRCRIDSDRGWLALFRTISGFITLLVSISMTVCGLLEDIFILIVLLDISTLFAVPILLYPIILLHYVHARSHATAEGRSHSENDPFGTRLIQLEGLDQFVGLHGNGSDLRRSGRRWHVRPMAFVEESCSVRTCQHRVNLSGTGIRSSRYYFNSTTPYRKCAANRISTEVGYANAVGSERSLFPVASWAHPPGGWGQGSHDLLPREEFQPVIAMTEETTTILVVDDEEDIADLYTTWLEMEHEVRTAYGGEQALEKVDEAVDIVFLDRQMPDHSGDEVLERIRDRGLDCRVVMVTAVDPDFDIVSMEFDDYLTKPVMREDLDEAVDSMLERDDYNETLQEYFALTSKKATLEAEKTPSELQESDEYQEMVDRVDELEAQADTAVTNFDDDFDSLFQEFPGGE